MAMSLSRVVAWYCSCISQSLLWTVTLNSATPVNMLSNPARTSTLRASNMQCAAVNIKLVAIIVPPQKLCWFLGRFKLKATWWGNWFSAADVPPTILSFRLSGSCRADTIANNPTTQRVKRTFIIKQQHNVLQRLNQVLAICLPFILKILLASRISCLIKTVSVCYW